MTTPHPHKWRKSSRSGGGDGNSCVEIADLTSTVAIRDSKNPDDSAITVTRGTFQMLISTVKNGHADL